MKYMSQGYLDEVKKKLEGATDEYLKNAKGLTWKMENLVTDCPDGVDKLVYWEFQDGKLVKATVQEEKAPSSWRTTPPDLNEVMFRSTASYETYAQLNRKEMEVMQAIIAMVYKLEGPLPTFMFRMTQFMAFTDAMAEIPCEY